MPYRVHNAPESKNKNMVFRNYVPYLKTLEGMFEVEEISTEQYWNQMYYNLKRIILHAYSEDKVESDKPKKKAKKYNSKYQEVYDEIKKLKSGEEYFIPFAYSEIESVYYSIRNWKKTNNVNCEVKRKSLGDKIGITVIMVYNPLLSDNSNGI